MKTKKFNYCWENSFLESLSILELTHLALVTEMEFIWKGKNSKIENSTLCNAYKNGRLKNVYIFSRCKLAMLLNRLFDNNFHQLKIIPLYLISQYLEKKNLF